MIDSIKSFGQVNKDADGKCFVAIALCNLSSISRAAMDVVFLL